MENENNLDNARAEYLNFLKQEISSYCNSNGSFELYWDSEDIETLKNELSTIVSNYNGEEDFLTYVEDYVISSMDNGSWFPEDEFYTQIEKDIKNSDEQIRAYYEENSDNLSEDLAEAGYKGVDYNIASVLDRININVNVMIAPYNEQNFDMNSIITAFGSDYQTAELDLVDPEYLDNGVTYLIHQQGHTLMELYDELFGNNTTNSKLVKSVASEIQNNNAESMSGLTACATIKAMTYGNILKLIQTKNGYLEFPENTAMGIYNSWVGSGSTFDIELEKPFIVPVAYVRSITPDTSLDNGEYSVSDVYGDNLSNDTGITITNEAPDVVSEDLAETLKAVATKYGNADLEESLEESHIITEQVNDNIDIETISNFLSKSVQTLLNTSYTCCAYKLDNKLSLYVGWTNDPGSINETDIIHAPDSPDYIMIAGIKVSTSDYMQTDYDYLNFPYDSKTGEVFDTEYLITTDDDYDTIAKYFIEDYAELSKYELADDGEIITDQDNLEEARLGNNTFTDRDEAEYYRNKELYDHSGLARHREAMEKAKEACKQKGIEVDETRGVYESKEIKTEEIKTEELNSTEKPTTTSFNEDNIPYIEKVIRECGINNDNTVKRMAQDVAKELQNNFADDTISEDGIYYDVAIVEAIRNVIERITGRKPDLKIESKEIKTGNNIPEHVLETARNLFNEINRLDDMHSKTTDIEQGKKYVDKIQELTNRLNQIETQYHFGFLDNGEIKLNEVKTESVADTELEGSGEDQTQTQLDVEEAVEEVENPTEEDKLATEVANSSLDVLIADEKSAIEGYNGFLTQAKNTLLPPLYEVLEKEINEIIKDEEDHINKLNTIKSAFHIEDMPLDESIELDEGKTLSKDIKLKEIIKNATRQAKIDGYDQYIYKDSDGEYSFTRVEDENRKPIGKIEYEPKPHTVGTTKYIQLESKEIKTETTESYRVFLENVADKIAENLGINRNDIRIDGETSLLFRYNGNKYFARPKSMYQVDLFDDNNNQIGWGVAVDSIKQEVFTDYSKNDNMVYDLVGGEYAGTYTYDELVKLPIYIKDNDDTAIKDARNNGGFTQRKELDDQPVLNGYLGPMWNGVKDNQAHIRYETQDVYDMMSETKNIVEESSNAISREQELNQLLDLHVNTDIDKQSMYNYFNEVQMNNEFDEETYTTWLNNMLETNFEDIFEYLLNKDDELETELEDIYAEPVEESKSVKTETVNSIDNIRPDAKKAMQKLLATIEPNADGNEYKLQQAAMTVIDLLDKE